MGPLVLLEKGAPRSRVAVSALSVAVFLSLSYAFAYSVSGATTLDLWTAFSAYAGTVLFLTFFQLSIAGALARALGFELASFAVAVPSPLPSFLPVFEVKEGACDVGKYSTALSLSLLLSVALALLIARLDFIVMYPRVKPEIVALNVASLADITGLYSPLRSGALAFMLSAFFQLTFYPYSPSWALLGMSNVAVPLLIALSLSVSVEGSGAVLGGYALASALLSILLKERPAWKDPFSGPSRLSLAALLITLALVALVGGQQ
ncbi:MAG: hypothetical protein GXO07_00095 [Crenarchaeota archaeon]|nr:hypothetical protein [Thermoproteota archaeon]